MTEDPQQNHKSSTISPPDPAKQLPRKKVGVLLPSTDTSLERELTTYLPADVSIHVARIPLTDITEDSLKAMGEAAMEAARLIADIRPDIVVYGCTSGTFVAGREYDEALKARLEKTVGAPVITVAGCVSDLLVEQQMDDLAIYAPYTRELCEKLVAYLGDCGINTRAVYAMEITDDRQVGSISAEQTADMVSDNPVPEASGVLVSCTNLESIRRLPDLHRSLKTPVISSNLSVIRALCRFFSSHESDPLLESCGLNTADG